MSEDLTFDILAENHIGSMALLGKEYNQKLTIRIIEEYLKELFSFNNYHCFGVFLNTELIGFASGWITIKFNSGRQLELDNVIIDPSNQSRDLGVRFFAFIETWAKKNNCKGVELDTYPQNSRVHKFLLNQEYSIVGFHFQKSI
ncbi:GNAT family N-acetyltransferase [Desertivirga arenae]|uniref:GNAT family N-acetyltransferase n=1 Tax=Desertivirga arenae TaxID=2810309 RepID=UPI001A9740BA|nr:GNAT family N-acetyltransferase [Pedobacter sp. SYSU D00823]